MSEMCKIFNLLCLFHVASVLLRLFQYAEVLRPAVPAEVPQHLCVHLTRPAGPASLLKKREQAYTWQRKALFYYRIFIGGLKQFRPPVCADCCSSRTARARSPAESG